MFVDMGEEISSKKQNESSVAACFRIPLKLAVGL